MHINTLCRDEGVYTNGHTPVPEEQPPMRMAVVGMACRLPGQVSTPEDLWKLCSRGRSAWSEMPRDRFNHAAFHHPNPQRNGTFNPRGGHFLDEDVGRFDAPFFNITLQEARSLDPQQRLALECTYEALENGGLSKQSVAGQNVGVFAGASISDYEMRNLRDPDTIPMHQATGNALSLQSNRISYYFDLTGPSFTVDTACSSSLTALHLACQSLRAGESSAAVVSGAHLSLTPELFISMSNSSLFSESGRSYAFDHKASGFGRGEGVGCVILKPLEDALAAGDQVRAIVAGSGVNQDGRTRGITLPNSAAQEALIRSVYKNSRIDPAETGFIEAHGTGTKAGDPLEASALHAVFGPGRSPKDPLFIGSVKTNVGHAEGASGVISVIKAVLMLEKGFVLPNSNFEKANEEIPMDEWNLKVPRKLVPWPRGKRYISINNFGFGGGNAHVVLERMPVLHDGGAAEEPSPLAHKVVTLSGHDERAVKEQGKALGFYLEQHPAVFDASLLNNLAYTLCQRRTVFPWRVVLSGSATGDLIRQLSSDLKPSRAPASPVVGFVFTGQGAQWPAMGRELLPTYPVFRETMEAVDDCLASLGATFSIIDEILFRDASSSSISRAYMSQPACTAVQLALTDLLRSWGVRPSAVTGHSSGEIGAAYAAGILSLEECVRIAYARGVAAALLSTDSTNGKGSMMAVGAGSADVQPYLDALQGHRAVVACINSESSVTVSGDDTAINELHATMEKQGLFARKLQVDVAYHSHHMQRVAKKYRAFIGAIAPRESSVSFNSSVHGEAIPPSELTTSYWVDNLVSRVEFVLGLRSLLSQKVAVGDAHKPVNTIVEIGPHCALQTPVKQIIGHHFRNAKVQYAPSLRRKVNAVEAMQQLAMTLWTQGLALDFEAVNFPDVQAGVQRKPTLLNNLPQYPWDHSESYWHTARLSDNVYHRPFPRNDILGALSMENVDLEPRWRNVIWADDHPWIRQHRVHENSVYPMAGFMAMAVEAVSQQAALHNLVLDRIEMREVSVGRALTVSETASVETMLSMKPCSSAPGKSVNLEHEFCIFSWTESRGWDEHCRGFIVGLESKKPNPVDGRRQQAHKVAEMAQQAADIRAACNTPVDEEFLYNNVAECGVHYGPLFQGLSNVSFSKNREGVATLTVPDTKSCMPRETESSCIVHPALLDLVVQLVWVVLGYGQPGPTDTQLPSFVQRVSITPSHAFEAGSKLLLYGRHDRVQSTRTPASNRIYAALPEDPANPVIQIEGCVTIPLPNDDGSVSGAKPLCFREQFEPCFDFLSEADSDVIAAPESSTGPGAKRSLLLDDAAQLYLQRLVKEIKEPEVSSFKQHHQRLFRWAQQVCSTSNVSVGYGRESEAADEMLLQKARNMHAAGELTCKIGECLPQILRGEIDPLSIMLEDDLLGRHYEDNDHMRQTYGRATPCIDKMAHQNPHLSFLEIGAGTGGATLPILQTLGGENGTTPRFSHFMFTDISLGFFEKARTKFQTWDHLMSYQTLDISSDPIPQGFEPHSYDVILACNVLHATPRIRETLANTRRLLKPGGKLLLIEETRLQPSHLKYAVLPGWWLSEDADRTNGPVLLPSHWNEVLQEMGFSGVDIGIDDYPGLPAVSSTLMVSTATDVQTDHVPSEIVVLGSRNPRPALSNTLMGGLTNMTGLSATVGDLVASDVEGKLCVFLDTPDAPLLSVQSPTEFKALQRLLARASGVLWVVQKGDAGPESLGAHLAIGLARTVRSESSVSFATLDVDQKGALSEAQLAEKISQVFYGVFFNQSVLRNKDMDFVIRGGRVCVPRVVEDPALNQCLFQDVAQAPPQVKPLQQPSRPLKMLPGPGGILADCYFTDDSAMESSLPENYVEIQVTCVGLNFRDVLVAIGQIPGGSIGQECSGVISAVGAAVEEFRVGDRVCSMTAGSMATHIRCPATNAWRVPNTMPLELAASVPVVFCTAYYSLVEVGRLAAGESVLIHAAAGGVGQAAIMVAQEVGAEVFATVSSEQKKRLLIESYHVPEEHIFFSRDISFAQSINKATGGQGVDVVLNSLSGEALRMTFECLAPFGRFVELGKRDIVQNSRLEMGHFDKNVSFSSVDLTLIIAKRPALLQRLFRETFRLLSKPSVQARWSIMTFSIAEIEAAFRALQGGRTTGKAVVRMDDDARVKVHPAHKPGNIFGPDASYVITGGTSGIGLDIARWLPENGARHIVLVSRSGASTEEAQKTVRDLEAEGVNVQVCRCDVGDADAMQRVLTPVLLRMPPVRGVIYGAMTLRDMLFEKMELEDYNAVIRVRVSGILNLQRTLQCQEQPGLDFFVNLSSVASVVGTMGQAAYASGGTFMAAMAQYPELAGVPCRTIDLPMVRDAGYLAADKSRLDQASHQLGGASVDASDIRALLAAAVRDELRDTCDNHCLFGLHAIKSSPVAELPFWAQDPKLSHLLRASILAETESSDVQHSNAEVSPGAAVRHASSRTSAEALIAQALVRKLASTLMRPVDEIDPAAQISAYGLDSLVAIEIRNWITRELEASLQILEILTSDSVHALSRVILNKTTLVPPRVRAEWEQETPNGTNGVNGVNGVNGT